MTIDPAVLADPNKFMAEALAQAHAAQARGEVPVGALAVMDGTVLSARGNERQSSGDPTAHAEVLAIRDAAAVLGEWRLEQVTIVVTLEPCPMCAGALWASRIGGVVFGADDPKAGATGSLYHLGSDPRLNHEYAVLGGVMVEECSTLLSEFFSNLRR
jgi:tRNA(adenine34) deaminase